MNENLIENYSQLIEYLENGCKSKENWKIGTEHEKFGFVKKTYDPLTYSGDQGILVILESLAKLGWERKYEGDNIVALSLQGQSITLEPGGQLELSGAPLNNIHETCREVNSHLKQLRGISEKLGVGFIGLGFHPYLKLDQIPLMPKARYKIMKNYMPKKGKHGLDMMFRTCTVQTNLDYSSEEDMVKKLRVSLALQPLSTALFANSPFIEGKVSGFKSLRSHVWSNTDDDRCGMLPFVFEKGMSFQKYVDYALNVPMYFVVRNKKYIDAKGQTFNDFLNSSLDCLPNEKPNINDWENHLSTLFPEVRLKTFLEMRGADTGSWSSLCANPAFWVGLLYDEQSLNDAYQLISEFNLEDILKMRKNVPIHGLHTQINDNFSMNDLAFKVLDISKKGLKRRKVFDASGNDESIFIDTLIERQKKLETPADKLIKLYNTQWDSDINHVFKDDMA